jgi:hypothetical protein
MLSINAYAAASQVAADLAVAKRLHDYTQAGQPVYDQGRFAQE